MEDLSDRIRNVLAGDPNIGEIRMFGGLCFALNGNMLVGRMKAGGLLVRVGTDLETEALKRPGATRMAFTGREMKGFIVVQPDALVEDDALRSWIALATSYVGPMPPKEKKRARRTDRPQLNA